jgi:hypothetical protein
MKAFFPLISGVGTGASTVLTPTPAELFFGVPSRMMGRGGETRDEQEAGEEFREVAKHVSLQDSKRLCC